jgi:glutathione S-transferase
MPQELLFPALATMIALCVYTVQGAYVGIARNKYNVKAPKITGNEDFERVFRVHYNTLETLPTFLIPLWIFALLISANVAGWLGILWSVGRVGYMYGYYKSADKRHSYGSWLSSISFVVLFVGSLYGIIIKMIG